MKVLFIINPKAGRGKTDVLVQTIQNVFDNNDLECKIEFTRFPKDATDIVRKYVSQDDYMVVVVGGDGTLHEAMLGIVGSNSTLAVMPNGTGNDFAKMVSIELKKHSHDKMIRNYLNARMERIDCAMINEEYFLNSACFALDAHTANQKDLVDKHKFIPRKLAYIYSLLHAIFTYKGHDCTIDIDGKQVYAGKTMLLTVNNGKFYGSGIPVSPDASFSDGLLDVVYVPMVSKWLVPIVFPILLMGRHRTSRFFRFHTGKHIIIDFGENWDGNVDGELITAAKYDIVIQEASLALLIPEDI